MNALAALCGSSRRRQLDATISRRSLVEIVRLLFISCATNCGLNSNPNSVPELQMILEYCESKVVQPELHSCSGNSRFSLVSMCIAFAESIGNAWGPTQRSSPVQYVTPSIAARNYNFTYNNLAPVSSYRYLHTIGPPSPPLATWIFHGNYIRDRLFYTAHLSSCLIGLPGSASASASAAAAIAIPMAIADADCCCCCIAAIAIASYATWLSCELPMQYLCEFRNMQHSSRHTHTHTKYHTCSCSLHGNQLRLNSGNKAWRVHSDSLEIYVMQWNM